MPIMPSMREAILAHKERRRRSIVGYFLKDFHEALENDSTTNAFDEKYLEKLGKISVQLTKRARRLVTINSVLLAILILSHAPLEIEIVILGIKISKFSSFREFCLLFLASNTMTFAFAVDRGLIVSEMIEKIVRRKFKGSIGDFKLIEYLGLNNELLRQTTLDRLPKNSAHTPYYFISNGITLISILTLVILFYLVVVYFSVATILNPTFSFIFSLSLVLCSLGLHVAAILEFLLGILPALTGEQPSTQEQP